MYAPWRFFDNTTILQPHRQFELMQHYSINIADSMMQKSLTPIYFFKPFRKFSIETALRNILLPCPSKKLEFCESVLR